MWKEVQRARKKSRHPNLSRKPLDLVLSRPSLTTVSQEPPFEEYIRSVFSAASQTLASLRESLGVFKDRVFIERYFRSFVLLILGYCPGALGSFVLPWCIYLGVLGRVVSKVKNILWPGAPQRIIYNHKLVGSIVNYL